MKNMEYVKFIKQYAKKHNKTYMCVISEASKEYRKLKENKQNKTDEKKAEKKAEKKEEETDLIKMLNVFKDIEKQVEILRTSAKEKQSTEQRKLTILINKAKSFTNNNVINQRLFNSKLKALIK